MKNPTILALAVASLVCAHASGQETEPLSRTVFKLSPQHFTHNALKAGVERFNKNHSSSFAIFITGRLDNNEDSYFDREGYNGLAGEFQIRKYISPMKEHTSKKNNVYNQGVYGGAYLQGGAYSGEFAEQFMTYDPVTGMYVPTTQYDYKETIGNWGLGFTIGYQKTLWQVIFLEAFIGGGIQFSDRTVSGNPGDYYNGYDGITDPGYKGILPKIGLHIGIGL
jgi:hypothetical protein